MQSWNTPCTVESAVGLRRKRTFTPRVNKGEYPTLNMRLRSGPFSLRSTSSLFPGRRKLSYARGIHEANKRNQATRRERRLLAFPFHVRNLLVFLYCGALYPLRTILSGKKSEHFRASGRASG